MPCGLTRPEVDQLVLESVRAAENDPEGKRIKSQLTRLRPPTAMDDQGRRAYRFEIIDRMEDAGCRLDDGFTFEAVVAAETVGALSQLTWDHRDGEFIDDLEAAAAGAADGRAKRPRRRKGSTRKSTTSKSRRPAKKKPARRRKPSGSKRGSPRGAAKRAGTRRAGPKRRGRKTGATKRGARGKSRRSGRSPG